MLAHRTPTSREIIFAVLVAALFFGLGAYLSTFPTEIVRLAGLLVIAASIIGLAAWFWWGYRRPKLSAALVMIGTALITIGAIVGLVGAFMIDKESTARLVEKSSPLDNTVAFACAWSKPPGHYREDKTLAIVDFQGVPISGIDFNRQSAGPMRFIRSSEPFQSSDHYSNMWYRCDITNHGSQTIRNLRTKFPVVYSAVVPTENGTRSGEMIAAGFALSPNFDLAAGETDYFYFANASAAFVSVLPPNSAMLQTLTDGTVHEVRVVTSSSWHVSLLPSPKPLNANTDLAPQ